MEKIKLFHRNRFPATELHPPASKSESNRALIIDALSGGTSALQNLSTARDTQTLQRLLNSSDETLDVLDAGTTMRFLTAYLSSRQEERILTGTARMCQRPIGILVEALRQLGASIDYLAEEGFPPLRIRGMNRQLRNRIELPGDVSSQYISALLMIAPTLTEGLTLQLTGKIGSRPYIEMTRSLMKTFGADSEWTDESTLNVKPQAYQPINYTIETDWSGASYWYSTVALADEARLTIKGLRNDSLQGDIRMHELMRIFGVETTFTSEGVTLFKVPANLPEDLLTIDFSDIPDMAQTVAVVCAAKGIRCLMTGLESLRIKETDRTMALKTELAKLGTSFEEQESGSWLLTPGSDAWKDLPDLCFATYDDHRMAMAFAPLATMTDITLEDPKVVNKSYPSFWEDLTKLGVKGVVSI